MVYFEVKTLSHGPGFKINADKCKGILMVEHVAREIRQGIQIWCMCDFKLPP